MYGIMYDIMTEPDLWNTPITSLTSGEIATLENEISRLEKLLPSRPTPKSGTRAYSRLYQKWWRQTHPEEFAAQKARWTARRKAKLAEPGYEKPVASRRKDESFAKYIRRRWPIIRNTKRAAGHKFTIWPEDVDWVKTCPILDIPINYSGKVGDFDMWSMDRLDPAAGYVKGNVFVISFRANRIKDNGTAAEHRRIAEWMDATARMSKGWGSDTPTKRLVEAPQRR